MNDKIEALIELNGAIAKVCRDAMSVNEQFDMGYCYAMSLVRGMIADLICNHYNDIAVGVEE